MLLDYSIIVIFVKLADQVGIVGCLKLLDVRYVQQGADIQVEEFELNL